MTIQTNNLFVIKWETTSGNQVQLRLTIELSVNIDTKNGLRSPPASSQDSITVSAINAANIENRPYPKAPYAHVEQALSDYHFSSRLAENPLIRMLNLDLDGFPKGKGIHTPGRVLRRLLDQTIDVISGVSPATTLSPADWRLKHYLHLRYREKIEQKELASGLGYTKRHLLYLHRELVMEAAELMVDQCDKAIPEK